jgi:hypothetical protein
MLCLYHPGDDAGNKFQLLFWPGPWQCYVANTRPSLITSVTVPIVSIEGRFNFFGQPQLFLSMFVFKLLLCVLSVSLSPRTYPTLDPSVYYYPRLVLSVIFVNCQWQYIHYFSFFLDSRDIALANGTSLHSDSFSVCVLSYGPFIFRSLFDLAFLQWFHKYCSPWLRVRAFCTRQPCMTCFSFLYSFAHLPLQRPCIGYFDPSRSLYTGLQLDHVSHLRDNHILLIPVSVCVIS